MYQFRLSLCTPGIYQLCKKVAKICQESAKNQLVNDCIYTPSSHTPALSSQRGPRPPGPKTGGRAVTSLWPPSMNMMFDLAFLASVLRSFTPRNKHLVSPFNKKNDQCIKAHLLRWFPAILKKNVIFGLAFLASVFRLFTHRRRYLVSSFNMENDQRIKAHLLRWFPASF